MINRKRQSLALKSKEQQWELTVWEANWDMASIPDRIEKEVQELRKDANGSTDYNRLSFHEHVYPWLFAYSTGNVPSLDEAYELPDDELDKWYCAVRSNNPDLFPEELPPDTTVTFRDSSSFVVRSSHFPSCLRRLFQLDNLAHAYLAEHTTDLATFSRMKVYAKMACCSLGDIPTFDEIGDWPATELQRWYGAVLISNPHLFLSPEELEARRIEELEQATSKKNSQPPKLSNSSQASSRRKRQTSQLSST